MYGQFVCEAPAGIDKDSSWKWLVQSDLKVQTEATICAAQEQALIYEHCPEGVVENDDIKLIWDINNQRDNVIEARRPDLILVDKKGKSCIIIDIAVPGDCRICRVSKLEERAEKAWSLKKVEIVPVVVGGLGCISKGFSRWMDIGMVQKSVLLGTARILRKVLDM